MSTTHEAGDGALSVRSGPSCATTMLVPDGVAVLSLAGAVDAHTVADAVQAAARVARRSPRAVVVDLSTVRVDAEGLVVLVVIRRRLARQGLRVVVAGGAEIARLLDAARLSPLFLTFPTVDDAVRALTAA